MTKTTAEEDFTLFKKPTSKEEFFMWSYIGTLASIFLSVWLDTNQMAGGSEPWRLLLLALVPATFLFLYWLFIRWVASTAEKSGRSYVAFMLVAIFFPLISWIIVIMFKKPEPPKI